MGYTHYFFRGKCASAKSWAEFTQEVRTILSHPAISNLVCEEYTKPDLPPVVDDIKVAFNGKGENGHETFFFTRAPHHECCKTGGISQMDYSDSWGKHYDVAVCCVLIAARHHLKERVSSDGNWTDEGWMRARALHAHVTSRIVPCPWPQKLCSQCGRSFSRNGHAWGGHRSCCKCGSGSCRCDENGTTCSQCGAKNSLRHAKPTSWCWYCANGYKNKEDAAEALAKQWDSLIEALKSRRLQRLQT